ncbi:MAG: ATP-binding protein, partial [Bacteroidales bacterium]|nr:ATP-binding protein [Bacteroidales bacterium]
DAVTGNVIDGTLYGVAKRWWGTVLDKEKKPHQIELDVVAESLDKKKILIGECKWTSGENAAVLENELRWKASMLPFAKGKEVVPVIFAKNATNLTDTAIVITPEGIMDLMK